MLPQESFSVLTGTGGAGHGGGPEVYLVIFVIIFLENGFPPMIWLPGDSLLFLIGMLTARDLLSLPAILGASITAAFLGYQCSYLLGRFIGLPLITTSFSRIISEKSLHRSHLFSCRWGTAAILIGRFIPVIRTLTPFLAGISRMDFKVFSVVNFLGAILWPLVVCGSGYLFAALPYPAAFRDLVFSIVIVLFGLSIITSLAVIIVTGIRTWMVMNQNGKD